MRRLLLAAAIATLSLPSFAATRGLNAADLVTLARISEAQLAPDGRSVVYTLRETDLAADRGRSDLWLQGLDAGALPRRLTGSEENDTAADWAPDGSGIYFLSARGGSTQVWYLPVTGGEAAAVTSLPLDVGSFRISPRGDRLLLGIEVFPDCGDLDCSRKRLDEQKAAKQHGQLYDQLFVRHWDTWEDGRVSQLFALAVDAGHKASGSPVSLTATLDADVPSKPFGGREDFAFSPDGSMVLFSARIRGRIEPRSTNFDVYRVPVAGGAEPVNLTAENQAWDAHPAFSRDGKLVAYLAMERAGFEADRFISSCAISRAAQFDSRPATGIAPSPHSASPRTARMSTR